jgi:hypothetical protein
MDENDAWKTNLRLQLEDLIDESIGSGRAASDVLATIAALVAEIASAQDRDPDPADDPVTTVVPEPANDWPGAR